VTVVRKGNRKSHEVSAEEGKAKKKSMMLKDFYKFQSRQAKREGKEFLSECKGMTDALYRIGSFEKEV
jgi:hypothetical protein